jgi:tRNA(Ile)-lysidine synthase
MALQKVQPLRCAFFCPSKPDIYMVTLINHPFIRKIYQTVKQYGMLHKGDSVLVGVSGGPDSIALLHVLVALSDLMGLRLGVAHLNHCLRKAAADSDEKFVKSVATELDLPVFIEKTDILKEQKKKGLSLEEAGRDARYHFFHTVCRKMQFNKIAVGHHQDDNAEQILLNLIRGSGPAGVCGIPPVRENIVRPLIQTSRAEIMKYLTTQKTNFVIDESNNDERFTRNKIRHHLIPLLKRDYNPQISEALNRFSVILKSEEEWISDLINPFYDQAVLNTDDRKIALSVSVLLTFHLAAQRRVLRKAILKIKSNLRRITSSHIDSIIQIINKKYTDARLDLPDQIRIFKQADQLIVQKEPQNLRTITSTALEKKQTFFEYLISRSTIESESSVYISEINTRITFNKIPSAQIQNLSGQGNFTAFFDSDRLKFPIVIRNFRPGDKFFPFGMTGTQKLNHFFNNNKVLPEKRSTIPIFFSRDKIIWVGGFRIADPIKVTPETKTVLRVDLSFEKKPDNN